MSDRDQLILDKLKTKACLKQSVYVQTMETFNQLKEISQSIAESLSEAITKIDDKVVVEYSDRGELEFHIKFSGDTLVFQMHSNISRLPDQDPIYKNEYLSENPDNKYFGSIRVYNFLSDSIKYNRINDMGILLARLFVNRDKHYHIESQTLFHNLQPNIAKNVVTKESLTFFIHNAMITAIDSDLLAPAYKNIQVVSWQQQQINNQGKAGSKLGFQMNMD